MGVFSIIVFGLRKQNGLNLKFGTASISAVSRPVGDGDQKKYSKILRNLLGHGINLAKPRKLIIFLELSGGK